MLIRVLLIVAVLAVAFWVVSIVDCSVQHPSRHRGVSKTAWLAIVILLPVVGGVLWFVIGRARRPRAAAGTVAPDDDPRFLGSIGSTADQDERIRRLEEELARLDSEDFDFDFGSHPGMAADRKDPPDSDGDDPRGPHRGMTG